MFALEFDMGTWARDLQFKRTDHARRALKGGVMAACVACAVMLVPVSHAAAQSASGAISQAAAPTSAPNSTSSGAPNGSGNVKTGVVQIGTGLIALVVAISIGAKLKGAGGAGSSKRSGRRATPQSPSGSTRFR